MTTPAKHRGPATWAAVREAYLAGEPAAEVADRFDITVAALRQRANRGRWTRRQLALAAEAPLARQAALRRAQLAAAAPPRPDGLAPDGPAPDGAPPGGVADSAPPCAPPPTVSEALDLALVRAAALLEAGREAEASRALKMGETLARLAQTARAVRSITLEEALALNAEMRAAFEAHSDRAARAALNDPSHAGPLTDWAYRWRAEHLGPECAAEDEKKRKERAIVFRN